MKKKYLPAAVLLIYFTVTLLIYLYSDPMGLIANIFYVASGIFAILGSVYTIKIYGFKNPHAQAVLLIAIGLGMKFIAELIWAVLEFGFGVYPFPSIADLFFLLAYPFLLLGLAQEFRINKFNWGICQVFSGTLLAVLLGSLVIYFGVYKAFNPEESLLNNAIAIFYGIGDLVILIMIIGILLIVSEYHKGKLFLPWFQVFLGFLLMLIADILFAIYGPEYEESDGYYRQILDLAWIGSYLFLAYGIYKIGYVVHKARNILIRTK